MMNRLLIFGLVMALLSSCKTKVPEDVIEKGKMESLLYDYHLAQALAKNKKDSVTYYLHLYTDAVYRKYKITEADFNHSMEWYTRNSEELFKIYQNIDKRFDAADSDEQIQGNPYASMTAVGDTMNIWAGKNFYLLSNQGNNFVQFKQDADSTFSEGDRLMWQFESSWYYREGQKNGMIALSLVYENDSVVSTTQSIYSTGSQDIYITVGDMPVKSVQGFIYQMAEWTEEPKLLVISAPVLVKFKKKSPKIERPLNKVGDSGLKMSESSTASTVLSEDSLKAIQKSLHDDRVVDTETPNVENQRILHLPK